MSTEILRRGLWPLLAILAEAALQLSGYKNVPLALALAGVAISLAGYALWPVVSKKKRKKRSEGSPRPKPESGMMSGGPATVVFAGDSADNTIGLIETDSERVVETRDRARRNRVDEIKQVRR